MYVAGLQRGEWLKYTFDAGAGGSYRLALDGQGKGRVSLVLNGTPVGAWTGRAGSVAWCWRRAATRWW